MLDKDRLRIIGKRMEKALDSRGQHSVPQCVLNILLCRDSRLHRIKRLGRCAAAAFFCLQPFRHVDCNTLRHRDNECLKAARFGRRDALPELQHDIIDAFLRILCRMQMSACDIHNGFAVFIGQRIYGTLVPCLK